MKAKITFGNGCAISDKMFYVPSYLDELDEDIEHTRMFVLNMETPPYWFHHEIHEATIIATCFRQENKISERACYSLSNKGFVEVFNSTETIRDEIFKTPELAMNEGEMCDIKHIGKHAYACGSGNQVYKNTLLGWVSISSTIRALATQKLSDAVDKIGKQTSTPDAAKANLINATKDLRDFTILHSIDGLEESSIYTCGTNGKIWHWNGLHWKSINSGTKQHLHDIHCISEDTILICGHNGTVLEGNHKTGFKRLATNKIPTNFWSIRKFQETIYLGSSRGLFKLTGSKITPCPTTLYTPCTYSVQAIDSKDDTLWIAADKFILRYQDNHWDLIEHPDNA